MYSLLPGTAGLVEVLVFVYYNKHYFNVHSTLRASLFKAYVLAFRKMDFF